MHNPEGHGDTEEPCVSVLREAHSSVQRWTPPTPPNSVHKENKALGVVFHVGHHHICPEGSGKNLLNQAGAGKLCLWS